MAVSVSLNDPVDNSSATNKTNGTNSLTSQNSQDLSNSFLTLLVAQLKTKIRPIRYKTMS